MEFLNFIAKHGKTYTSREDFEHRASIFRSNLAKIRAENAKPENTFRVTINHFADWTPAEFKEILLSPSNQDRGISIQIPSESA